jgi:hypothetical protein
VVPDPWEDFEAEILLVIIKGFLGGNLRYRNSQDTYYYGSTSYGSAFRSLEYLFKKY